MLKSPSTSLIVRDILALAVGAIALAWPGVGAVLPIISAVCSRSMASTAASAA